MKAIRPEFVEFAPPTLEPAVLYISNRFKTALHLCACGCGEKVVTPLSPSKWQLVCDGSTVSLHPSIGNWDYACRSHYFIRRNQIVWSGQMTRADVARVQARDSRDALAEIAARNTMKRQTIWQRVRIALSMLGKFFGRP